MLLVVFLVEKKEMFLVVIERGVCPVEREFVGPVCVCSVWYSLVVVVVVFVFVFVIVFVFAFVVH